jgi:hypothetical protein
LSISSVKPSTGRCKPRWRPEEQGASSTGLALATQDFKGGLFAKSQTLASLLDTNCTGKGLGFTDHKAWSESCIVCKKTREALAVRFCNRPPTYPQAVCLDHCPVVSLVVEKEPEKQGPGRPKGSVNRMPRAGASQVPHVTARCAGCYSPGHRLVLSVLQTDSLTTDSLTTDSLTIDSWHLQLPM